MLQKVIQDMSVGSFGDVVAHTLCPFSTHARWYEQACVEASSTQASLIATAEALKIAIPRVESEGYDMLALAVSKPEWSHNINALAGFLRDILPCLSDDTSGWGEEATMLKHEWRLWVGGIQCLVLTFAPFYDPRHPRHSTTDKAYVVFQFQSAFERAGVATMSPVALARLSRSVMTRFENAHRWYLSEITHKLPEALRIIKPLHPGEPPIAWWCVSQSDGDEQ